MTLTDEDKRNNERDVEEHIARLQNELINIKLYNRFPCDCAESECVKSRNHYRICRVIKDFVDPAWAK
jgi:hypothetical protein